MDSAIVLNGSWQAARDVLTPLLDENPHYIEGLMAMGMTFTTEHTRAERLKDVTAGFVP